MEPISFDQIKVFLAVVETGSFSAAARRLRRAQSAVSYAIANLEGQLGLSLFERTNQRPILSENGRALLEDARKVESDLDGLRARARGLAKGLESELSIVVDVMFPIDRLVGLLHDFRAAFPSVPLRFYAEALGGAAQLVIDGTCVIGVMGTLPDVPDRLIGEALPPIELIAVAAPSHPLAAAPDRIPLSRLGEEVQLVLTDRSRLTEGRDFGVMSLRTWRLGDLAAKHAMLRAGLGWGSLPRHMVEEDLRAGALVQLWPAAWAEPLLRLPLQVVRRADAALGPAASWLLDHLRAACQSATVSPPST